jgi:glutaredoxin 3
MSKVTIYTTALCGYCHSAKSLLRKKKVEFTEIDVSGDRKAREALVEKSGGRTTVPQIWIGETHVGGCDDLYALDRQGRLDAMLTG